MKKGILSFGISLGLILSLFAPVGTGVHAASSDIINVSSVDDFCSEHEYAENLDRTWVYQSVGAGKLKVTFSEDTFVENGSDYIYVMDGQDNVLDIYTGSLLAGKTVAVEGDTIKVRLVSDDSNNGYGFSVVSVATMDSISVTNLPLKKTYFVNQLAEYDGLEITGVYSDGTTETLRDYELGSYDTDTPGEKNVSVFYNSLQTSFELNYVEASAVDDDEDDWDDDEDDWGDDDWYDEDEYYEEWGFYDSYELAIGKTKKLHIIDDEDDEVNTDGLDLIWESSDSEIATVDSEGNVTGISPGKVVITATYKDHKMTCDVIISKPKLSAKKLTLDVEENKSLKVTGYSGKIKWKTANRKIAVVNSQGRVTGKKGGSTVVSATVNGCTLSCNVKVRTPKISKKKLTLGFKKSKKIKVLNYKGKVKWKSANKKIATVNSSGKIVAKTQTGNTTITATLSNGKRFKCKVTVKDLTYAKVVKTYPAKALGADTVWYEDRLDNYHKFGETVVFPFGLANNTELIFSFFPKAATKFAIFDSNNHKKVWEKTISSEAHIKLSLPKGNYQLKALCQNKKDWDNGYSIRVVNNAAPFMPIELGHFSIDTAGGVEPEFLILNNTGKTIKYINFNLRFYNAVGDMVYNDIGWDEYEEHLQIIGPIPAWYCDWYSWDPVFYSKVVHSIEINGVEIIFMDGTTKKLPLVKRYYRN